MCVIRAITGKQQTTRMKISIITATYNSAATIADTINSVLSQDYSDIEYLVIDGGSSDATIEIVKEAR